MQAHCPAAPPSLTPPTHRHSAANVSAILTHLPTPIHHVSSAIDLSSAAKNHPYSLPFNRGTHTESVGSYYTMDATAMTNTLGLSMAPPVLTSCHSYPSCFTEACPQKLGRSTNPPQPDDTTHRSDGPPQSDEHRPPNELHESNDTDRSEVRHPSNDHQGSIDADRANGEAGKRVGGWTQSARVCGGAPRSMESSGKGRECSMEGSSASAAKPSMEGAGKGREDTVGKEGESGGDGGEKKRVGGWTQSARGGGEEEECPKRRIGGWTQSLRG